MHVETAREGGLSFFRPAEHKTKARSCLHVPVVLLEGIVRDEGTGMSCSRLRDCDRIPDILQSADEHHRLVMGSMTD